MSGSPLADGVPRGRGSRSWPGLWLLLALAAVAPWLGLYPVLGMRVMCFALLACAFNLLAGYGGLISFGHAAMFGGAGYIVGEALVQWHLPTPLGVLLGVGFAACVGLGMGLVSVRRSGIYFSMITLALAQIVYFYFLQASFTGGEDGLQGIPRGTLLGLSLQPDRVLYEVVLCAFALSWWFMRRINRSPFGQILRAARENEPRLVSLGYHAARYKLGVFVLSAAFAGLAGALKALVMGLVSVRRSGIYFSMITLARAHGPAQARHGRGNQRGAGGRLRCRGDRGAGTRDGAQRVPPGRPADRLVDDPAQ